MNFKKEIRKLLQTGMEPKEAYKKFEAQAKSEAEKEELALIVAKTPIKSKKANIFNYIYIALIVFATFFEIYSLFSSESLAQSIKLAFKQQVNLGNEAFSTISVDDFLSIFRIYISVLTALVTGVATFFLIRKNLIVYRVLYVSNIIYAALISIGSLIAMIKLGFNISEVINCILCYLLVYLNYKIIKLYFPYLNIVFGLRKNKEGKWLIQN